MQQHMTISFTPSEGALPRLLGAIERRGFIVHAMDMRPPKETSETADTGVQTEQTAQAPQASQNPQPPLAELNLSLSPRMPDKCKDALSRHLSLLPDVIAVRDA